MLKLNDPSLLQNKCFINGTWVGAEQSMTVNNPANGELVGAVPRLGRNETRQAIEAANAAWSGWKALTAKERSTLLKKWHGLILENQEDLAMIMTSEQGKPLAEARGEILYAASFIEWFAEEAKRVYGETIPAPVKGQRIVVSKEPVGVCAAITPWNFPAAMITRKVGPALAAGCTVVIKPASQTPLTALALLVLAERAGFPSGVISIVTGAASEIGAELCSNPLVRKVSFTGSTEVGRLLMEQSAATIKKVSMELGGNAPFIVFDDADIDAAVQGAIASKFRNAGQTCVCTNRLYVQSAVYEAFTEKLAAVVKKLKIGSGTEPDVEIGPLIDHKAVEKVEQHIADALDKQGKLLAGGKRSSKGEHFFEPTVIVNANQEMLVAREETFGPLAAVFKFETEEEVIRMANDTEYGLAAYFYSQNMPRIWRVGEGLEYGMVGINTGLISNEVAPFGGVKQSGLGREGSHFGMDDYLVIKYMCMAGI